MVSIVCVGAENVRKAYALYHSEIAKISSYVVGDRNIIVFHLK